MKQDFTPYIAAVLAGASINSQAKIAGVAQTTLQRLVIKHPDYAKAKAEGKLHAKGLPGVTPVDPDLAKRALSDVDGGLTIQDAALKNGMPVSTLTKLFHKHNPGVKAQRGGLGTPRSHESRLDRAKQKVERCRKALEDAEKDLEGLKVLAQPQ